MIIVTELSHSMADNDAVVYRAASSTNCLFCCSFDQAFMHIIEDTCSIRDKHKTVNGKRAYDWKVDVLCTGDYRAVCISDLSVKAGFESCYFIIDTEASVDYSAIQQQESRMAKQPFGYDDKPENGDIVLCDGRNFSLAAFFDDKFYGLRYCSATHELYIFPEDLWTDEDGTCKYIAKIGKTILPKDAFEEDRQTANQLLMFYESIFVKEDNDVS